MPSRDDRTAALRAWCLTSRGLGQGLVSQTTRSSAARHARTRSDRTSVNATNNSPRRGVLLTRSVQKDLSEPRPPGKVSTGRMACDLCAPHASPSPMRRRRSRYLPRIAPSLPITHPCAELRAGAEDFPSIPGCGPSRLAAGPTRLPVLTPCARNAHGGVVLFGVPGDPRFSDPRSRERAGHVLHRRQPPQGQIMRKSISASAVTAVVPLPSRPAAVLPDTGFLRQPQVLAFVPFSKSTLWRRIQARTFPQPLKLSARVTVWRAEDIRNWIARQTLPS